MERLQKVEGTEMGDALFRALSIGDDIAGRGW